MTISEMAIMLKEERYGDFGKTFRSPGHVCLLRGADGLVKNRRGHTERGRHYKRIFERIISYT